MPQRALLLLTVALSWLATAVQVLALLGRGGFPADPLYWFFGVILFIWLACLVATFRVSGIQATWAVLGSAPLLLLNLWLGLVVYSCSRDACF